MKRFPYKKLPKYPHLRPKDVTIWEKFIDNHPNYFEKVDYDVKVGAGMELDPEAEEPYASDIKHLSKKRIDVVGYVKDEVWIIEVKPRAGLMAIGQALGLADLYSPEGDLSKAILPCIITDEEVPDIRQICDERGIIYLIA